MRNLEFELQKKEKQIQELYVLIDTLQTNLRSAVSSLPEEGKEKIVNVRSFKWCMNWRQGNEVE